MKPSVLTAVLVLAALAAPPVASAAPMSRAEAPHASRVPRPRIDPRRAADAYRRRIDLQLRASHQRIERALRLRRVRPEQQEQIRHDVTRGRAVIYQTVRQVVGDGRLTQADVHYVNLLAEAIRSDLAGRHGPLDSWKLIAY